MLWLLLAVSSTSLVRGGVITQYFSFDEWGTLPETSLLGTEGFNSYDGYLASPVTGTVAGVQWSAASPTGLYAGSAGGSPVMSVDRARDPLDVSFTHPGGLVGVGGNIFATDINFALMPGDISVMVTLADATSETFSRSISGTTDFWGFYSSGSPIASISVTLGDGYARPAYPSIDNLTFMKHQRPISAVPETGISLLALGLVMMGMVCLRRHLRHPVGNRP
jgi:hypothetical protein